MLGKYLSIHLLFLLCGFYSYSQTPEIVFKHFTTEQGLSASLVRCVLQDRTGYLWFGTYSGLDRYDGLNFKTYKNIPGNRASITNGFVQCMLEDKNGNLWVGTTNGLDKLNPSTGTFMHYKPFDKINPLDWNKNNILSIEEDSNGYLWLGTGDGLNKFDPSTGSFIHYFNLKSDTNSLRHNVIYAILKDKKGTLWIGTGNGLDKYDSNTGSFIHYWRDSIYREGFYNDWTKCKYWITALYEDMDGTLWIGTQGGLLELNSERSKFIFYEYDPKNSGCISFHAVTSICQENQNALWIGTWSGLNLFDKKTKKFTRIYHDDKLINSLSHNSIASVFRERSGTLWVSTYGGGVNKVNRTTYPFNQYSLQTWKENKRFSSASIMDISKAHDGSLWIATPAGLINFNPITEKLRYNRVKQNCRIVHEDRKGNLWIGLNSSSGRGLIKIEKNGRIINITDSNGNKFPYLINGFVEYNDSTLWICTEDIGAIGKVNTLTNKFIIPLKIFTTLNAIHQDIKGLLWIGTRESGLICYDPAKNKIIDHFISDPKKPFSISGNTILTIFESKDSTLWLGTNIGLNKFDRRGKVFHSFTESNGLPHNWAYQIFEDNKNNLWISTLKGVSKFIPNTKTFKTYEVLSGIVSEDRSGVGCKTDNGFIYLVSPRGLIKFHPDSIKDNRFVPPVVITNVSVSGKHIQFGKELILQHNDNNISIEFAALSYISPWKNLYAYKLDGVEKTGYLRDHIDMHLIEIWNREIIPFMLKALTMTAYGMKTVLPLK